MRYESTNYFIYDTMYTLIIMMMILLYLMTIIKSNDEYDDQKLMTKTQTSSAS